MSRRREEQDLMDKIILKTLKKGWVRWTDLEKKGFSHVSPFCDAYQIRQPSKIPTEKGLYRKVSRGIYRITESGEKYMEII